MTNTISDEEDFKSIQERERLLVNWAWFKFRQAYPDEKSCIEMLVQHLSQLGRNLCHQCDSSNIENVDLRTFRCLDCRKSSWFTSGTFFDHGKKLEAILGAIWLWESGVNCSANYFARLANIATSTAAQIFKKIALVVNDKMADSAITLVSKDFMQLFLRRSRLTPAKEHPSSEQRALEEEVLQKRLNAPTQEKAQQDSAPDITLLTLSYRELKLYETLTAVPKNFDELQGCSNLQAGALSATLLMLEMCNLVKRLPGELYVRLESEPLESDSDKALPEGFNKRSLLKSIRDFVALTEKGISRKYLQLDLARYWCVADRIKWGAGKILALCTQAKPITPADIEMFVTSLQVYVSPVMADRTFGVTKKSSLSY